MFPWANRIKGGEQLHKIITMQHSFSVLESPKACEILATLAKNQGKLRITEIMVIVGGSARTSTVRIDELKTAGLISDKKDKTFPFNRYISLTKKGTLVAKRLIEIEQIMVPVEKEGTTTIELGTEPGVKVFNPKALNK